MERRCLMKRCPIRRLLFLVFIFLFIPAGLATAQVSFRVPILISDSTGLARIDTTIQVVLGVHPNGTGCASIFVHYSGFPDHWDLKSFYPWNSAVCEPMPPTPFVLTRIYAQMQGCGDNMVVQLKSRPLVDTFAVQVIQTDSFPNSVKYYRWPDPQALRQYCDSMIMTGTVAIRDSYDVSNDQWVQVRTTLRINMTQVPYYRVFPYPPSTAGSLQTQLLSFRVFIYGPKSPSVLPPASVQKLLPAAGDTAVILSPQLTWNSVAGIARYHLQVSTDSTFNNDSTASFVFNDTLPPSATSYLLTGLAPGRKYYWEVFAYTIYGYSYPVTPVWWFRTQPVVGVGGMPPWIPATYALYQNHPNPFNPETEIRYQLPETSPVTLRIYNVLGEQVIGLVEGVQSPGMHTVRWNASGQPGGVYFYRLTAGAFSETKRMVLIR
jgi:hypothetical protein